MTCTRTTQPARLLAAAGLLFAALSAGARPPARQSVAGDRLFGISREEYAARRRAVHDSAKDALLLVCGPGEGADIEFTRFRTSNNLLYLTGVEAAGACLALLPEGDPTGKREALFLKNKRGAGIWTDPGFSPGEAAERGTGIQSVQDVREIWGALKPSIEKAKSVWLTGPVGGTSAGFPNGGGTAETGRYLPNAAAEEAIRRINPKATIAGGAERLIHRLRWRKSPAEVENLRGAIAATGAAERAAARTIRPGVTELAVEGQILAAFRAGGAVREGFPSIVGSGPNSIILHHYSGHRTILSGETVVVDIGAEYNYYSADITRTFPSSGRFTPRQRELYDLVLATQEACAKYIQPGKTTLGELNQHAAQLLRGSPLRARDAAGEVRTMDAFMPHGLGHWLGMDVHDVGGGSSVLMPGVVFTIEPGVYIPSEGIGIRIEDDYLITESGVEKLSRGIPSRPSEIEALMRPAESSPRPAPARRLRR